MWFVALVACGDPEPGRHPAADPVPDPFHRVTIDQLPATLDATTSRCEGDRWVVQADVAGRAGAARAIVVRTEGEPLAVELPLARQDMPEGSLWERYADTVPASLGACDAPHAATVVELADAGGKVVDCVAFGPGAAAVVGGRADDRLGGVAKGDWSRCSVR